MRKIGLLALLFIVNTLFCFTQSESVIYTKKFNSKNSNSELINQLSPAGVDSIMCGQTANSRNVSKLDVNPYVKFALSAMTALLQYQNNKYLFIKF